MFCICKTPQKLYQVIYADPPWRYDFSKSDNREIENHYPTMSVEEICSLKVPSDKNSVLYLWATAPKLREALRVMESWGFEYKTHAVWDKGMIGMGYWFRGQHELLLVGTKGKYSPPPQSERKSSIFSEKRTKHSKKPLSVLMHITAWNVGANKLEMFSREKHEGWDVWGNEVQSDTAIDSR